MLSTVHLFALLPAKEECELDEAVQEKEEEEVVIDEDIANEDAE